MAYGAIEYNEEGFPKCEICGKYFKRVISHVRQKHFINEREYKLRFGLDLSKGVCSKESSNKSRQAVLENYSVIERNLIEAGNNTRKKKGVPNKRVLSEQTKNSLKEWATSAPMSIHKIESGRKVGLSGLGNKKRWQNE